MFDDFDCQVQSDEFNSEYYDWISSFENEEEQDEDCEYERYM